MVTQWVPPERHLMETGGELITINFEGPVALLGLVFELVDEKLDEF